MIRTDADLLLLVLFFGLLTTGASAGETPGTTFRVRENVPGDAAVGADTVSEITWADSLGVPRTVQFVTGSKKYNPGWLSRYVYDNPPITVNAVDGGSGGLTDVSHNGGMLKGRGRGEWSTKNHKITWLLRGTHHGIVRVEYEMPFMIGEKQVSKETIRVVRDLFFADGTDHVVYSITLDFSKVPKNKASVDTRSPYMRWDWDGSGGGMGPYTGVKCGTDGTLVCENTRTATGLFVKTLNDNTVPYAYQWNADSGRCAAIIATRPYAELPQGSECWAQNADPILPAGRWQRDQMKAWELPYQIGGYSGWIEKLTWQVPYDLGHEKVVVGKYSYSAWPAYSYATLVLLDRLERKSFERLLAEQELIPATRATAAVGRMIAEASPGPGREKERVALATPGYDPETRAWRFACAENRADVTIDPGTGTLVNPVLIFEDYRGNKVPEIPGTLVSLDLERSLVYATVASKEAGKIRVAF
jgi:hypothetical protein